MGAYRSETVEVNGASTLFGFFFPKKIFFIEFHKYPPNSNKADLDFTSSLKIYFVEYSLCRNPLLYFNLVLIL